MCQVFALASVKFSLVFRLGIMWGWGQRKKEEREREEVLVGTHKCTRTTKSLPNTVPHKNYLNNK